MDKMISMLASCLFCTLITSDITAAETVKSIELPAGVTRCLSNNYTSFKVANRYNINNNGWNAGAASNPHYQYIFDGTNGSYFFGWKWSWNNVSDNNILSYPEVLVGYSPWAQTSEHPADIPFRAGEKNVASTFDITENFSGTSGRLTYDLAYDIWIISNTSSPDNVKFKDVTCEIMIWLDSSVNNIPGNLKSSGSIEANGATFDFYTKSVWGGPDHFWIYAAFNAKEKVLKSANFDITPFISYLIERKIINPRDYVSTVELGTEIAVGTGITIISNYSVNISDK
jgi:hypothetical protein